ncbi:hypothetical protein IV494_12430 [Kaistella sp. G5-32]|uniref:Lipoprotein n=1 Tax=Kaistella gelatinilytica TaxID=2787636 RepID=A0ABS0FE40_9FLAO|nr:hypothetical protein [Kaistella gelatinilytica]MBF8457984.1 hypothetical protein [Kaistella gelatinilytica]
MYQFLKFLFVIVFYGFISCNEKSTEKEVVKNSAKSILNCDLHEAQNEILKLPEVMSKNKMIDSLTTHKQGISLMSDSTTIDGTVFYEINAGYNSDIRYETYYNFYVEKGNCSNIKIAEPIEGDIIPISEWRMRNRDKNKKKQPANLENFPYRSFVISCGSGCAMTYSAIDIKRNSGNISVIFSVDNYIDEVLTDTFEDEFIFTYDDSNSLKKITQKGDKEDFLKTQSASSQKSFEKFATDLIQFIENKTIDTNAVATRNNPILLPLTGSTIEISDHPMTEKFEFIKIEGDIPSSVIEINKNLLLTWFDGDTERWYLVTIENKKVIDQLLVGKSETVETEKETFDNYIEFTIDKNLIVELKYSYGKGFDSRKIQKTEKYKIKSNHFVRL